MENKLTVVDKVIALWGALAIVFCLCGLCAEYIKCSNIPELSVDFIDDDEIKAFEEDLNRWDCEIFHERHTDCKAD